MNDKTLFGVQARLGVLRDLCYTLADGYERSQDNPLLYGAFRALGDSIDREVDALEALEKAEEETTGRGWRCWPRSLRHAIVGMP